MYRPVYTLIEVEIMDRIQTGQRAVKDGLVCYQKYIIVNAMYKTLLKHSDTTNPNLEI